MTKIRDEIVSKFKKDRSIKDSYVLSEDENYLIDQIAIEKAENLPISDVSESNCEHPTNQTEDAEHDEWYYCHKCKSYFC